MSHPELFSCGLCSDCSRWFESGCWLDVGAAHIQPASTLKPPRSAEGAEACEICDEKFRDDSYHNPLRRAPQARAVKQTLFYPCVY